MNSGEVRWGVLGAGFIANRFASDVARVDGARIVAVAARDEARAAAFAELHGIPSAYGGYDGLLADPAVDVVYVATPQHLHAEVASRVIAAGKGALVEKPFTLDAGQAELLVHAARERGTFLMEALWTRCNPVVVELARRIRDGAIGDPQSVTSNLGPLGVPFERGQGWRGADRSSGGGFLLECLVYPVALSGMLVPSLLEPRTVSATATFSPLGIDESASITVVDHHGRLATTSGGFAFGVPTSEPSRLQVVGTAGWATIEDNLIDPASAVMHTPSGVETIRSPDPDRGLGWQIEEASRAIREGRAESALVPLDDSVRAMRLLDRARETAGIHLGRAS